MRTAILATLVVAALAPTAARADEPCPVNGLDCLAVSQFSATADATSDAFFVTALALPIGLELGRGLGDDALRRGAAYVSAVGATALTAGDDELAAQGRQVGGQGELHGGRGPDVFAAVDGGGDEDGWALMRAIEDKQRKFGGRTGEGEIEDFGLARARRGGDAGDGEGGF